MNAKIEKSLKQLRDIYHTYGSLHTYVAHSGGKDSCVIHDLVKRVTHNPKLIHNPKTSTHWLTNQFVDNLEKECNLVKVQSESMELYVKLHDFKAQIDGTRIDEKDRTEKSDDFIVDGSNVNRESLTSFVEKGIFGLSIVYPIYDWTETEVWQYIKNNNLKISGEYNE